GTLMVANRTFERAAAGAADVGGPAVPFERFGRMLHTADLVISAAGGDLPIRPAMVEEAMRERRGRPMLFIDLAVPRSIAPAVNELDGVYLFDVDDLDDVVAENRGARASEAGRAEALVEAEVEALWKGARGPDRLPTL